MKFFFLSLLLFLAGCSGNIVLDNPRDVAVTFIFDGNSQHDLAANSSSTIDLEAGKHRVEVRSVGGEILGDTTFQLKADGEGLVHSGGSNYLIWRQLYGLQKDRKILLNERWVEFDSIRAFGDLKVYPKSWLFVEKSWDLGLEDELPASKTLYMTDDFSIEAKLFRTPEFIKTYKGMAQE
ncbi:MAG TPA: hypothetical protein ENJ82_12310 [Bacteroidetes bacterium]|nr:hypothetical protein [Bacteroidota bacterium]